jgi:hypothetical protein
MEQQTTQNYINIIEIVFTFIDIKYIFIVEMIADSYFRKSSQCDRYKIMLEAKESRFKAMELGHVSSNTITVDWIYNSLKVPILVEDGRNILGLKLPYDCARLSDVANIIGSHYPVRVRSVSHM